MIILWIAAAAVFITAAISGLGAAVISSVEVILRNALRESRKAQAYADLEPDLSDIGTLKELLLISASAILPVLGGLLILLYTILNKPY